jgi:hypothetical protein
MKLSRKLVGLGASVLVAANVAGLTLLYRQRFAPETIKNNPTFAARQQRLMHTVTTAAGALPPVSFAAPATMITTPQFEAFFEAVQSEDVFRVKVWSPAQQIVWSNARQEIGQKFADNHEVDEALEGETEIEIQRGNTKTEQRSERLYTDFSETYIPIRDGGGQVIGVAEVYQSITDTMTSIQRRFYQVMALCLGSSAVMIAGGAMLARRKR